MGSLTTTRIRQFLIDHFHIDPAIFQQEKEKVGRAIIRAVKSDYVAEHWPLVFVLFYPEWQLTEMNWRESFLLNTLNELNIEYVDTKPMLLRYAGANGLALSDLYDQDNGHPNELANRVIAGLIFSALMDPVVHRGK